MYAWVSAMQINADVYKYHKFLMRMHEKVKHSLQKNLLWITCFFAEGVICFFAEGLEIWKKAFYNTYVYI